MTAPKLYSAYFDKFTIQLTANHARLGSYAGDATNAIQYLLGIPEIHNQLDEIPADILSSELEEYGAWDEEELKDHQANKQRILWIACGDIREEYKL